MKIWILTSAMLMASVSTAFAATVGDDTTCQADTTRQDMRSDAQQPQPAQTQAATSPAPRVVVPVQREASVTPPTRADVTRRRNGKPIPDSELIAPHGAL